MHVHTHHAGFGKNSWISVDEGKMVLENKGKTTTSIIKNSVVVEVRTKSEKGKSQCVYGKFRKNWEDGKLTSHYRFNAQNSRHGKGVTRHGKGFKWTELLGYKGKLKQVYYNGSLMKEKFVYTTGIVAYEAKRRDSSKVFVMKYPTGLIACRVMSETSLVMQFAWKHRAIEHNFAEELSTMWRYPIKSENYSIEWWDAQGLPVFSGRCENAQKVGKWNEQGKDTYYLKGVSVSEHIFNTPTEDLKVMEILGIENAQLRSALLSKFPSQGLFDKIKAEGVAVKELIDDVGQMRLFTIPIPGIADAGSGTNRDRVMKFLEVTCPTTHSKYMLRVPPESSTCEEARQWTFHKNFKRDFNNDLNFIPREEFMQFAQET